MTNIVNGAKRKIKNNSTTIAWGVAGIAALGCAFFTGVIMGEKTFELYLIAKDDAGGYKTSLVSEPV